MSEDERGSEKAVEDKKEGVVPWRAETRAEAKARTRRGHWFGLNSNAGAGSGAGSGSGSGWRRRYRRSLVLLPFIAVGLLFAFMALIYVTPLPAPTMPVPTTLYDTNNSVVASLSTTNRIDVPLADMSDWIKKAIVAIEDVRFYQHRGIDFIGLARAAVKDIEAGQIVEGGSTITQQLARTMFLTQQRTFTRKFWEALLTFKLEMKYTKPEILEMYLNQVYFGSGNYGVEAAARNYFGKHAKDLTLPESAMIAGLTRSPEYYSPFNSADRARARRDYVLSRMAELKQVTDAEARDARATPLGVTGPGFGAGTVQYFVQYVLSEISGRHPDVARDIYAGGYRVYTTLDGNMQDAAERSFTANIGAGTKDDQGVTQPQGALVAVDPRNGHIKAMVGGRDYRESQFNRAYQAFRQPGSTFKPFLYSAAIEAGYTAASTQFCGPVSFPGSGGAPYQPKDYGNEPYHYQNMTMRRGVTISDNVTAVKWGSVVGPNRIVQYAHAMGVTTPIESNLSIALGSAAVTPLEMASGFATLANMGVHSEPMSVIRVEDHYGAVMEDNRPQQYHAIDEKTAFIMTSLLRSVMDDPTGTGSLLTPTVGRPVAGKTGTTDEYRDAWFVGFTPDLVSAVYVGFDDPATPVNQVGGRLAGPIWAQFMHDALDGRPPLDFARPQGIVDVVICKETGLLPNPTCPTITEVFVAGSQPTTVDPTNHLTGAPGQTPGTPGTPAPTPAPTPSAPGQPRLRLPFTWPF